MKSDHRSLEKNGTPNSSPSKSPVTPVMKQKKSPFVKSPLSLKKSAMGVKSPTSPKHIILGNILKGSYQATLPSTQTATHIPGPVIITDSLNGSLPKPGNLPKPGSPIMSIIQPTKTGSMPTGLVTSQPLIVKVTPQNTQVKRAVAKKHTGKRTLTAKSAYVSPASTGR